MPITPCLEPRCPNPATWRGRCHDHARTNDRAIRRAGYHIYRTARWRHTRDRYLATHPICEHCNQAIAEHVHHIVDLDNGGNPWDPAGLQALCAPCHNRETRTRQTRGRA